MSAIGDRLAQVRERIAAAAERAGRAPQDVTLVAVSKTVGIDALREGLAAGIGDLGENRVRELKDKLAVLGPMARWHFVGHLQTNKVRHVAGLVELIHSVDRFGLAEAISRRVAPSGKVQNVLIEVNLAGESSKSGIDPPRLLPLAREIAQLEGIQIRGVMAIPPAPSSPLGSTSGPAPGAPRVYFKELAALRDLLASEVPSATELSMGMSGDYETAVEEGATIVRVGEAIFGPRARP